MAPGPHMSGIGVTKRQHIRIAPYHWPGKIAHCNWDHGKKLKAIFIRMMPPTIGTIVSGTSETSARSSVPKNREEKVSSSV